MNSHTGSLGLIPMNSKNDTARLAGVSEEDVIANTDSTGITPQNNELNHPNITQGNPIYDTLRKDYKFAKSMSPLSPRSKIHIPSSNNLQTSQNGDVTITDTSESQTTVSNGSQLNHSAFTHQQQISNAINDPHLSSRSYNMASNSVSRHPSGPKATLSLLNKESLSPNNLSSRSNTSATNYSFNSSNYYNTHANNTTQSNNLGAINNSYTVNQGRFPQSSSTNIAKTTTFNTQPEIHSQVVFQTPERSVSPFRDPMNMHLKQINDQQRPMYTPAVLRVMKNSVADSAISDLGFDVNTMPSERPKLMKSESTASLRSTASSVREYWNYLIGSNSNCKEEPGPTRRHWKSDSSRFNCAQCGKIFNYLSESRRKHHCRSCGDIFCGDCLKNYIYLDENAKFTLFDTNWDADDEDQTINEKKHLCKVCHQCFQKYEEYVLDHTTRDHNLGADGKDFQSKNNDGKDPSVDRQNLPVDWDWSSF